MKGKHTIRVRNRRVQFELELERNITVIRGNSGTGKTTLIGMLRDYESLGEQSGVSVLSDKPCRVLMYADWETRLQDIKDSIVFIDEGNAFVSSRDFANAICGTSNYYVLITRESLYQLPYSVEAVLELRKTTTRSSGNTRCTYNKAYPYYKTVPKVGEQIPSFDKIITEDSNAGHQMVSHIAQLHNIKCESAGGKSNVFQKINTQDSNRVLVVADGAAFGADMEKVYQFLLEYPGHVTLFLPESFEWLILKAGVVRSSTIERILTAPQEYIDSEKYFSWEQYFTELLIELTHDQEYMRYNKTKLVPFYLQPENVRKLLAAIELD